MKWNKEKENMGPIVQINSLIEGHKCSQAMYRENNDIGGNNAGYPRTSTSAMVMAMI